jgi:hypothetical protein
LVPADDATDPKGKPSTSALEASTVAQGWCEEITWPEGAIAKSTEYCAAFSGGLEALYQVRTSKKTSNRMEDKRMTNKWRRRTRRKRKRRRQMMETMKKKRRRGQKKKGERKRRRK